MARVAQSEHDLLLVARALVGQVPFEAVEMLLRQPRELKPRIGPTAARLLRETLAVGCVRQLLRRGGWQRTAAVAGKAIVRGRLWERHAAPQLHFSSLSMQLCRWLLSSRLSLPSLPSLLSLPDTPPTLADELLLYLACDLLSPSLITMLARQRAVGLSPLCRLAFADVLGPLPPLALAPWLEGGGALLVEALQPDLARHWIALAQRQSLTIKPDALIAAGTAQEQIATQFLDGAEALGRRDLGHFIVIAAARLGAGEARAVATRLCADVDATAPLSARAAARRAVGAPLRAFARIGRWHEEHKLVRHFDDGYDVAQHLLHQWEPYQALFPVAEGVLRELESLDAGVAQKG
jgi:hypothetical protein